MEVFRLSSKRYADVLSGAGAALRGGRWNSKGTEVIYTAANRSLAMAEVLVHFPMGLVPRDYCMVTINIPDRVSVLNVKVEDLPKGWNVWPYIMQTASFGDAFIREERYCLMKVPSAVTAGDFSILINPSHPQAAGIKILNIVPFPFDRRLFR